MCIGGVVKQNRSLFVMLFIALFAIAMVAQSAPSGDVILKGAPMGGVKFNHPAHVKAAGKCDVCHHASKPEKPMTAKAEKCQNCHTTPAAAPMKTKTQAAFHDPAAKKGVCIDCHTQNAGKPNVPTSKCADCHQKANS